MRRWIAPSLLMLSTLTQAAHINDPRPSTTPNTRFLSFSSAPKSLDPARSYSLNEITFIGQIYEPPLQTHYLDRPYHLAPLTAKRMPTVTYLDTNKQPVTKTHRAIAFTRYTITLQPNIHYQPHWAFSKKPSKQCVEQEDQAHQPTRTLTASDYVYEIKRLASPRVNSPIYSLMAEHIVGLKDLRQRLIKASDKQPKTWLDLRKHALSGVNVINPLSFTILIQGNYPPFIYWLGMPFFAPIPWEADRLYAMPGMAKHNLSLDWLPIGTGPYYLKESNPEARMILIKNPNFHQEMYPTHGEPNDKAKGYLAHAGKQLPFIDEAIYQFEKESIPLWNKFLQGYYDNAGISADNFDQAIHVIGNGSIALSPSMKKKRIHLSTAVVPAIYYMGFNMLDPVVGGRNAKQRALRQAIAIAINYDEFITIFLNGRGIPAQSPIPPGIFGYQKGEDGTNPYVYTWLKGHRHRRSLNDAKTLMIKAGYPNGINPKTHRPLILHYDATGSGSPAMKAQYAWYRKQFAKLGIRLDIRSTLYNRFRDKVRTGQAQIFSWGWFADYPDPENFLTLFASSNAKVLHGGENASNYANPRFDALFKHIVITPNGEKRMALVNKAVAILQKDVPVLWGFHPITYALSHHWNSPEKPNGIAHNNLKYQSINLPDRDIKIAQWNQPIRWPLIVLFALILIVVGGLIWMYQRRDRQPMCKYYNKDDS